MIDENISKWFKYIRYYINIGSKLFVVFIAAAIYDVYVQSGYVDIVKAVVAVCAIAYVLRIVPWERIESLMVHDDKDKIPNS